jgi:glutamine amidotransferase class-I
MKIHFILHETFEVPGAYLAWAALSGHDVAMTKIYQDEKLPENVDSFDFLIVMGGPQSPIGDNSEFPYFDPKAEIDLIKKTIKADKYIVGACLGAQLLGEAYGGTTEKSPSCEIGNFPIELTEDGLEDKNIKHFGKQAITGHWHSDMPGLPDTAKVLAKSKGCPRQIIKYSEKHYGFQCHPEFTKKVAELLIDSDKDLEKKSQTLPFVQSPQTIRNNDYNEMNNLLYEFLDNLTNK